MGNGDDTPSAGRNGTALPDDPELRNRMRLREEFRMELIGGLDWLVKSENHLLKIFRFYILVLGAFISIISFRVDGTTSVANLLNFYTVSALVFWTIAVLSTVVAFAEMVAKKGLGRIHRPNIRTRPLGELVGRDKAAVFEELDLDELLDQPPSSFEDEILYQYIQSIQDNEREMSRIRYPFLYMGMFLMVFSVLLFGVGMLVPDLHATMPFESGAIFPSFHIVNAVGVVLFLCAIPVTTFLFLQMLAVSGRYYDGIKDTKAMNPLSTEGLGSFRYFPSNQPRTEEDNP